jgi:hypothetical protein
MNIYQRVAILLGSVVIALLFTVYPYKYHKEVVYHTGYKNAEVYKTELLTDYKNTALEGVAVGVLTAGIVVLLGAMKKKTI